MGCDCTSHRPTPASVQVLGSCSSMGEPRVITRPRHPALAPELAWLHEVQPHRGLPAGTGSAHGVNRARTEPAGLSHNHICEFRKFSCLKLG